MPNWPAPVPGTGGVLCQNSSQSLTRQVLSTGIDQQQSGIDRKGGQMEKPKKSCLILSVFGFSLLWLY